MLRNGLPRRGIVRVRRARFCVAYRLQPHSGMNKPIEDLLDRMASFEDSELPVVSLYLSLEADEHGRPRFERFLRKELKKRVQLLEDRSPARASLEEDAARIWSYLEGERDPSAGSAIVFACHGNGLFETLQTGAVIQGHHLSVGRRPELFHLARLSARHPRCAALVADTNAARILVFARGEAVDRDVVDNEKSSRTSGGGWSQMRYQRHTDHVRAQHIRETVEQLERIVTEDDVESIVLAGDDQVLARIRDELPARLADRVADEVRLDFQTPDHEVLERTLEAVRAHADMEDEDAVAALIGAYESGGLAAMGASDVVEALERGQVEEVLLTSDLTELSDDGEDENDGAARKWLAADIVAQARRTGAEVRLVEDDTLLRHAGGVGATLRYRL